MALTYRQKREARKQIKQFLKDIDDRVKNPVDWAKKKKERLAKEKLDNQAPFSKKVGV